MKTLITILLITVFWACKPQNKPDDLPNIIYIFTDQQHANMMSCTGNPWLNTPAMDYMAEHGIRFTRAYTTNPVCVPARVSLMTGRFPGAFKDDHGQVVRDNPGAVRISDISEEVQKTTLGAYLREADYDLIYGGKEHLPKPLLPGNLGFKDISDDERDELAIKAADFIRADHDKPFFMIISFINPHDICYMAIRDFATTDFDHLLINKGVTEVSTLDSAMQKPVNMSDEEFLASYCPPVPVNLEPQAGEPEAIRTLIEGRPFRKRARMEYTDTDWRMHRYAYCRLTEFVDRQIQVVIDALRDSGQEEKTLVMFSSDHGDHDAAHRMEHKSTLYEESANIPFLAMWKGKIPSGQVDSIHLVSNGLDLLPTVCDYAGIRGAADPRGHSLRSLFEGEEVAWRNTLGVESEVGRMVVHQDGYKYIQYDLGGYEEQLLDLNLDPYETTHFTDSADHRGILEELRQAFREEWFPEAQ